MKPSRENKKGKVNKYDAKNNAKQAKFPMRTIEMGEELLKYCNVFFPEFDFLLMLFYYVLVMFVLMGTFKCILPDQYTQTNLTYYMSMITLMLIWTNLGKNSFPAGYFRLSDESKMQLLFAFKTFFLLWALFSYTDGAFATFLGLNIE